MRFCSMTNIIIVGAGLSGLLSSLVLSHKGFNSIILEKNDISLPKNDLRNIALNPNTRNLLTEIGIWDKLDNYLAKVLDIFVFEGMKSYDMHFSANELSQEALAHMITANNLYNVLYNEVINSKFIKILSQVHDLEIDSQNRVVKYNDGKDSINYDVLLACNGKDSSIKHQLGLSNKKFKKYEQCAYVFSLKHEKPHNFSALEFFLPTGPLAILPLPNVQESSVVWSLKSSMVDMYQNLSNNDLIEAMNIQEFLGRVEITSDIKFFELDAHIIDKYFFDRVVFMSDSAHHIHPLAGQGFNQGVKDIKEFAELLSRYKKLGLVIDENMLNIYQKNRKMDNLKMYHLTDKCNFIFEQDSRILSSVRKIGMRLIDNCTILKSYIIRYASGN